VLAGADGGAIIAGVAATPPAEHPDLFGDGRAAERIADICEAFEPR